MTHKIEIGLLVLLCPRTGLEYSIGVEMDAMSFNSLPTLPMTACCPHCGKQHYWQASEAKLKLDDAMLAHGDCREPQARVA